MRENFTADWKCLLYNHFSHHPGLCLTSLQPLSRTLLVKIWTISNIIFLYLLYIFAHKVYNINLKHLKKRNIKVLCQDSVKMFLKMVLDYRHNDVHSKCQTLLLFPYFPPMKCSFFYSPVQSFFGKEAICLLHFWTPLPKRYLDIILVSPFALTKCQALSNTQFQLLVY